MEFVYANFTKRPVAYPLDYNARGFNRGVWSHRMEQLQNSDELVGQKLVIPVADLDPS